MVTRSGALLRTTAGGGGARSSSGGWRIGSLIGPSEAPRIAFHCTHQSEQKSACLPASGLWMPLP